MKPTRHHRREARLLWQSILVNGQPDAARIRQAVLAAPQKSGREAEAVLSCFAQRLDIYLRSRQVAVISADPLSAQQQGQLSALFADMQQSDPAIQFHTDPAVIGGLRVERDYQVIDRTVARQLEILKTLLLSN